MKFLPIALALCLLSIGSMAEAKKNGRAPSAVAKVEIISGKVFMPTKDKEVRKPAYTYEKVSTEINGERKARASYKDLNGQELIFEEYEYSGGKLTRHTYNQLQTNEFGTVDVKDGKVFFSFTSRNKKTTSSMDIEENMIAVDGLPKLITDNWMKIVAEEEVKFRFLLSEIKDTVGFKIFRNRELKYNGEDAVELKMKPSSIFIAAVVDPLFFIVAKNAPHNILFSKGRLPVRRAIQENPSDRDHWRAIDAEVELSYSPSSISSVSSSSPSAADGKSK